MARVTLFGSTARGEADPDSDIDLVVVVVVVNDLGDYWRRRQVKAELADAAKRASRRLDLHVTDRPEWKLRTKAGVGFLRGEPERRSGHADRELPP